MTVYHIPVCPFSQRLEILLALKDIQDVIEFHVVDITKPRDGWLLKKTRGTTALPVLETEQGDILKESLVILDYLEETFNSHPVRRKDIYERAVERMLIAKEGPFTMAGYHFVMNQEIGNRQSHVDKMLGFYADLNDFLTGHNPEGTFLFDEFGMAEVVYTPIFMRFFFLAYYENFDIPGTPDFDRVRKWRDACIQHPATQQVTPEGINKLYYDYALGAGNGALVAGRQCSSFAFEPHWQDRPMPPSDKYGSKASDAELGLLIGR